MKVIGTTEAAKRLGVSSNRVRALIESGRLKVANPDVYQRRLNLLLSKISLWPLTRSTAEFFGEIDQDLRRRGRILSQIDILLAALCRELDLTLVTTDKDFAALPWLKTEDWT